MPGSQKDHVTEASSQHPPLFRSLAALALLAFGVDAFAGIDLASNDTLTDLSLEELSQLSISSVSKKPEPLAGTAASVYVITAADISRSGASSLPEALRLAPNLQVARFSASGRAITARGFNTTAANKLMVLIDGRPIYTPLYSGVWWDTQDVYLPDVERIEVISGPNATIWGSNAVNGVINIVMKSAHATNGANATASIGEESAYGLRFGRASPRGSSYRIYGKHFTVDASENADGNSLADEAERNQVGFRFDSEETQDRFSIQGDVYDGEINAATTVLDISGGNLSAHWERGLDDDGAVSVNAYVDRTTRGNAAGLESNIDVFGINASHRLTAGRDHVIVWGSDVRHANDEVENVPTGGFLPARRDLDWISLFLQDEWRLRDDLSLILGARAEDNDYTGLEFMPNLRMAWQPGRQHTLWTSLSRSVRTPSRFDRDVYIPLAPPHIYAGGPQFDSEVTDTLELGWRAMPAENISWSVTVFHSEYDELRSLQFNDDGALEFSNGMSGSIGGLEGWWTWQVMRGWRIEGGLLLLDKNIELAPDHLAVAPNEGNDPDVQWRLRSSWDVADRGTLDVFLRHVDELPDPQVPSYTVVDARFAWRLLDNVELALKVRNLLDEEYAEFGAASTRPEFGREAWLQLTWSGE